MKAAVIHAFGEAPRFEDFAEPLLVKQAILACM